MPEAPQTNTPVLPGEGAAATGQSPPAQSDDESQFQAQLARRGLVMDGSRIVNKDRADFRAWKREQQQKLEADRKVFDAERDKARDQLTMAEQIMKLAADDDFDGLAKLLKFDGWDGMQQRAAARFTDPNYREVLALKKDAAERKAAEERAARDKREAEVAAQAAQARSTYMTELSETCKGSPDKVIRVMSQDPEFLSMIMAIQMEHYDPVAQDTITPEQALELVSDKRKTAFRSRLTALKDLLSEAFAEDPPTEDEKKKPSVGGKQTPKPKATVSRTAPSPTPSASAPKKWSEMTPAEQREYKRARLAEAKD